MYDSQLTAAYEMPRRLLCFCRRTARLARRVEARQLTVPTQCSHGPAPLTPVRPRLGLVARLVWLSLGGNLARVGRPFGSPGPVVWLSGLSFALLAARPSGGCCGGRCWSLCPVDDAGLSAAHPAVFCVPSTPSVFSVPGTVNCGLFMWRPVCVDSGCSLLRS